MSKMTNRKMANSMVAAAGEHYVAYKLSCLGYLAAPVRIGAPAADLLASTPDGGRTVAIQVKTTQTALRLRGRGDAKHPHHLEFPLGHAAVEKASDKLIFCFVDLREGQDGTSPDVYVVPAAKLLKEYEGKDIRQHSFFRHHRSVDQMARFKNNWRPIVDALS